MFGRLFRELKEFFESAEEPPGWEANVANGSAAHDRNISPSAGVGGSFAGAPVAAPVNLRPGERIVTDPVTGSKVIVGGERRSAFQALPKPEIRLQNTVPGLSARYDSTGLMIDFRWERNEPTDEADARDAQCRAGYDDDGFGFYGFEFENGIATWSCSRSSE